MTEKFITVYWRLVWNDKPLFSITQGEVSYFFYPLFTLWRCLVTSRSSSLAHSTLAENLMQILESERFVVGSNYENFTMSPPLTWNYIVSLYIEKEMLRIKTSVEKKTTQWKTKISPKVFPVKVQKPSGFFVV